MNVPHQDLLKYAKKRVKQGLDDIAILLLRINQEEQALTKYLLELKRYCSQEEIDDLFI